MKQEPDYKHEKAMYEYLQHHGCADLTLSLIDSDDQELILVFDRGVCDLRQFAEIRRDSGDPLDLEEIFLIAEYLATAMQRLGEIGVSLCDLKEMNVLVAFSNEKQGYFPILTDLGAAYCKRVK